MKSIRIIVSIITVTLLAFSSAHAKEFLVGVHMSLTGAVARAGDNPAFVLNMGQYQNGKIPIVWPKQLANSKMNYPALPW